MSLFGEANKRRFADRKATICGAKGDDSPIGGTRLRIAPTIRVVWVAYWLLLTVLLLAPDPLAMLGITSIPGSPGGRMEHLLAFFVLALLACASRPRLSWGMLAGLLVGYAVLTETLQALVPTRTVELLDYVENLLGLAAGWGLCRLIGPRGARPASTPEGDEETAEAPPAGPSQFGVGESPD